MEIAGLDRVGVGQAQPADARGGEVDGRGRSEAADADDKDLRGLEAKLSFPADLGEAQLACIAPEFLVGEGVPAWRMT